MNQYNNKDLTNKNYYNTNLLKAKGKLNLLQTSNSIKELYDSISHDLSVLENISKTDKDQLEPLSYSNDQSDTLFITNQNIEISSFVKEHIDIDENGNSNSRILPRIDSKSKLHKDIMNNSELSTESTTINKITVDKTLINDAPLKREKRTSSLTDQSFKNINNNSYSKLSNNQKYPKLSHNVNNNNINMKNHYISKDNSDGNRNSNINVNNDKDSAFPFNPPVLLRRRSSLNRSRSRSRTRSSSFGDRKNITPSNHQNHENNETGENTRQSRYSLLYNSDSNSNTSSDKLNINTGINNNPQYELSNPSKINNKLVPPKLTSRISSIGKVNKNDINSKGGNVNGNINAGVNHDDKINHEKVKPTNINSVPNGIQNNGIPNSPIINGNVDKKINGYIDPNSKVNSTSSSEEGKMEYKNMNRVSSSSNEQFSDKRNFANIPNLNKSFIDDNSSKRHSINVTNVSKSFNEDSSNKRHSVNVINIGRIDGNRTPKFRFSKIDENSITPTNSNSPKMDEKSNASSNRLTPKIDEKSSTSSNRLTPKSNKDKRHSFSSTAFEIPNKPDPMVKQKMSRKAKTLSLINLLSPKSSLSEISQKTNTSDLDDSNRSELHLPSKILFDDDINSLNNSSIHSSNIDSDVQTVNGKNKRFSIAKLTGIMIKKSNNKENKSKDNISMSSKKSGIKHYRGNYFGLADEDYDEEEEIEKEKFENNSDINSAPSKPINDHRSISHILASNDLPPRSPLIKTDDDHKYDEVSASSFKIIKNDKIEKKPMEMEGVKNREIKPDKVDKKPLGIEGNKNKEINNEESKSKSKFKSKSKSKSKSKKENGKVKGKKPIKEDENEIMKNESYIMNDKGKNNESIEVIKVNDVNEIIYYNNLNNNNGGDDDEWIDESVMSKKNNTRVKKKQSIRDIDHIMRKNTNRVKKEQRIKNEEPVMANNNNSNNNSNNNNNNNNSENAGVQKEQNNGDDEWIDESILEKGNIKKEVRKQQSTRSLKRREQSIRRRGQSRHRRKPTNGNLVVSSNSKKLESNPSILEKSDKVDRRDLSHGSIHYARSTTKFTVVKTYSTRNGNSVVPSRNGSVKNTPVLPSLTVDSNNNRLCDQSSLAKDIDTNRNSSYRQPITINEPATQLSSPNQSFILTKGDVSFSSMSAVSKVSSVKMKRNIIKRFFHMNLRRKNNKRKDKNKN